MGTRNIKKSSFSTDRGPHYLPFQLIYFTRLRRTHQNTVSSILLHYHINNIFPICLFFIKNIRLTYLKYRLHQSILGNQPNRIIFIFNPDIMCYNYSLGNASAKSFKKNYPNLLLPPPPLHKLRRIQIPPRICGIPATDRQTVFTTDLKM